MGFLFSLMRMTEYVTESLVLYKYDFIQLVTQIFFGLYCQESLNSFIRFDFLNSQLSFITSVF